MTASERARLVRDLIERARECHRRGDATLRNQMLRSIEEVPGLSRAAAEQAKREVFLDR